MWLFLAMIFGFVAWGFIFFPFNMGYLIGLTGKDMPDIITIIYIFLLGPIFLIIPIFFSLCLLGESICLWTIRWTRYNAVLQQEDNKKEKE